ncbi:MAG: hypothetical protein AAFN81_34985, partial [Bacteroidota bacterium]
TDPADDFNTVFLEISGSGPNGWTTTDEGWPDGAGMDGTFEFGPYLVSEGGFTIIILVPDAAPDCFQGVFVNNFACDQECEIGASVTGISTDDNGTPTICTDDTYTVTILAGISGSSSSSWLAETADQQLLTGGEYGAEILLGPFPIYRSDGTINTQELTIIDAEDFDCRAEDALIVEPPAEQEDCGCAIFADWELEIDDNGTPSFCFDDFVTATVIVNDINASSEGWTALDNRGIETSGFYGEPVVFGPYATWPETELAITFADALDPACSTSIFSDLFGTDCNFGPGLSMVFSGAQDCAEESFCVPVRVARFQDILGMQFSINYSDNLSFNRVESFNPNLLGWSPASVGRPMPQGPLLPGQMTFTWNDPLAGGVSLPLGDTLMVVCFDRTPGSSNDLQINFSSAPTPIEIVDI